MMDYKRKEEKKKHRETNTWKINRCIYLSNSVVYMAVRLACHTYIYIYMLDCFHVPWTKTIIQLKKR